MNNRQLIYWISQVTGWGTFVLGNILIGYFSDKLFRGTYIVSFCIFLSGIGTTHVFRMLIHQWGWKRLNIPQLIPRILASSFCMSLIFTLINTSITDLAQQTIPFSRIIWVDYITLILNFSALFMLWCIIYFATSIFQNWKREEIKNLELKAMNTEIELNSFRAQINPHFMFNALNSIRALVDEDPEKSKLAITMLSGILRNNMVLGRNQEVPLRDEMDLVDKYLSLEKIRFEERLDVRFEIDPQSLNCLLPPYMLQTIAENAIKHGISKIKEGGLVKVLACIEGEFLCIEVTNTGKLISRNDKGGIGIPNTQKRLELLYDGRASFSIAELNNEVITKFLIPQHQKHAT